MKIALFHNWSSLGLELAHALLDDAREEVVVIGARAGPDQMDLELVRHARKTGSLCIVAPDPCSEELVTGLRKLAPDLVLVATFPGKLPRAALEIPVLGAYNVHPSVLPRYRGAHPEFWVIRNGEAESGVTLHRMTERLDAGAILLQQRIPLGASETLGSLLAKMGPIGVELVRKLLDALRRGESLPELEQDEAAVTRAPRVRAEHCSVDWREPAAGIERLVRACHPFFVARASLGGSERPIRSCGVLSLRTRLQPGEFRPIPGTARLEVGTGEGSLSLELAE